jgi:hypothetical protein
VNSRSGSCAVGWPAQARGPQILQSLAELHRRRSDNGDVETHHGAGWVHELGSLTIDSWKSARELLTRTTSTSCSEHGRVGGGREAAHCRHEPLQWGPGVDTRDRRGVARRDPLLSSGFSPQVSAVVNAGNPPVRPYGNTARTIGRPIPTAGSQIWATSSMPTRSGFAGIVKTLAWGWGPPGATSATWISVRSEKNQPTPP